MKSSRLLFSILLVLTSCQPASRDQATLADDTAPEVEDAYDAPGSSADLVKTAEATDEKQQDRRWILTMEGLDPVKVGTTFEEAKKLVELANLYERLGECYYVLPEGGPDGLSFMVNEGTVVRAEVSPPSTIRTREGLGVGSTEADVRKVWGSKVTERPHKYTDGKYLVITDERNVERQLLFETDGDGVVTTMRAGLLPEVRWVEGCS